LRQRVLAAVQAEPAPSRDLVAAVDAWRIAGALAVTLALFAVRGGVRIGDRPWSLVVATALGAVAVMVAAGFVALARGRSMLGPPRARLWAMVAATPLVLLAWKWTWSSCFDAHGPTRLGLRCLGLSLAMAAAPMAALLGGRVRSHPLHPAATGAAVGAAVGAMSWTLVDLWCPVGYLQHLLIGHVLPLALIIGSGVFAGQRWLALRDRATRPR
jgi:hypothetical protein